MQLFIYSPADSLPFDPDPGHPEFVTVTAVTPTSFTAFFTKNHATTVGTTSVPLLIFSTRCVEAQYIEQADDFTGGQFTTIGPLSSGFPITYGATLSAAQARAVYPPANVPSPQPQPPPPYQYFPSSISGPLGQAQEFLYFEESSGIGVDFSGGFGGGNNTPTPPANYTQLALWPIQPGDYIEVNGSLVRRIKNVWAVLPHTGSPAFVLDPTKAVTKGIIQLDTLGGPLLGPFDSASTRYRIMRGPRPMGEEKLTLPKNIALDGGTNVLYGNLVIPNPLDRSVDILFAPSGRVVGRQSATDEIFFWVRDVSRPVTPPNFAEFGEGEPTLVALRTRSGMVSAHPVDKSNGFNPLSLPAPTPYRFARDGKAN